MIERIYYIYTLHSTFSKLLPLFFQNSLIVCRKRYLSQSLCSPNTPWWGLINEGLCGSEGGSLGQNLCNFLCCQYFKYKGDQEIELSVYVISGQHFANLFREKDFPTSLCHRPRIPLSIHPGSFRWGLPVCPALCWVSGAQWGALQMQSRGPPLNKWLKARCDLEIASLQVSQRRLLTKEKKSSEVFRASLSLCRP